MPFYGERAVKTNGRDFFGYVRHVQWAGNQHAWGEDLYRVQETGRICIRQKLSGGLVRWCSASRRAGGWYEAGAPFKDGVMVVLLDGAGREAGMEVTFRSKWVGSGLADKEFPFSWEREPEYPKD